jgi:hypothetical protein
MTMTTQIPTTIAECGCPYDPEYDEGSLGWHLPENHVPWTLSFLRADARSDRPARGNAPATHRPLRERGVTR